MQYNTHVTLIFTGGMQVRYWNFQGDFNLGAIVLSQDGCKTIGLSLLSFFDSFVQKIFLEPLYILGTVLDKEKIAVNKIGKDAAPMKLTFHINTT